MKNMNNRADTRDSDGALTNEAAAWFLRIRNDEVSAEDFAQWREWVNSSPAHTEAFDRVSEFWKRSDSMKDLPWPSDEELDNDNYDGIEGLVPPKSRKMSRWRSLAQVAAMLALVAAAGLIAAPRFLAPQNSTPDIYETNVAEHQTIDLNDGSKIVLGAMSQVAVDYTSAERNITLMSGEAFFDVAKDPSRPFVVAAGPRSVRAVGTAFNINFSEQVLAVSVVEGTVSIAAMQTNEIVTAAPAADTPKSNVQSNSFLLDDGQELIVSTSDNAEEIRTFSADVVTSWRTGKLTYIGEPLEKVIADLNRYSDRKILVTEDAINIMRFTGTVFNNDIGHWLDGLDKAFPVRIIFVEDSDLVLIASA